jgi:glycosyltransferase involved in cell wall biosynthesis
MITRKMNILLYKSSLYIGGAEKQIVLLANNLPGERFNVHVITHEADPTLTDKINGHVHFHVVPRKGYGGASRLLHKFLIDNSIDICHTWDFRSSLVGFFATRVCATKFIDGSIRSTPSREILRTDFIFRVQTIKVKIFSYLNVLLISNSQEGLRAYNVSNYKKSRVIYNAHAFGENLQDKESVSLNEGHRICMVANMRWKKDFETFIKAGLEVLKREEHVYFYLVGDGDNKQKYMDLLEGSASKEHFIFTGSMDNVDSFLPKMDVCVLCNELSGEGLSNSIMEYMVAKRPVIATKMGGNPELVIDGETGFLIAEKDATTLAEKISHLIEHPDLGESMGLKGYERVRKICDLSACIQAYENLYRELM